MIRLLMGVVLGVAGSLAALPASAQQWPSKPVKFIVPYPPAGSVDPLARLLGAKLGEALGQPFVVENRPGASGSIGTAVAVKSAADGYTFVYVFDTHAVVQALIPNLSYDPIKDLEPVMLVGIAPYAIVTHPTKPYRTVADIVSAAKAKPESVSFGSIGNGTVGHLILVIVQQAGGFKITHVPYKGGGPMVQDLLGQQIDLGIGSVALLAPQVRAGKVRALAVTGDKRSLAMPDVPTLIEQGFPGISAHAWWGILGPAGIPKPIVDRFHAELVKVLNLPDVKRTLGESLGMELVVSGPEALQAFVAAELERWGRVVRDNNIRAD